MPKQPLKHTAAALNLSWYGDERSLEALKLLLHDTDENIRAAAAWAIPSSEKFVLYHRQSGR
jgi:HEAT repeat protein